jgi:hypothetical protein
MKYMSQLAAITAAKNSTKQYAPYRTIAFGVLRCVMPKIIEANTANRMTVAK